VTTCDADEDLEVETLGEPQIRPGEQSPPPFVPSAQLPFCTAHHPNSLLPLIVQPEVMLSCFVMQAQHQHQQRSPAARA
jgi:hypothetical protein